MLRKAIVAGAVSALAMTTAIHAMAQETTSAVRGQVVDATGRGVANAAVTIVHEPSGTVSQVVTSDSGFYSARGLRAGGPYVLSVEAPNFQPQKVQVSSLGLGEPAQVDIRLFDAEQPTDLVVIADQLRKSTTGGPTTQYSEKAIQALPSISRDLKDVARLDPFAVIQDPDNQDALSFAGANTRYNQLTVDGIRQSDDFGLNNNGYPTQRSPISLEAVEAVQVSVAPYSVINNGFLGGAINAVTKSGGNEFSGSAFYERTSDSMAGDKIRDEKVDRQFKETVWGATLGGPIVKDKLFFFAAYEKFKGEFNLDEGPSDSGKLTLVPRITTGAVETFRAATQDVYDYDPGSWVDGAPAVSDEKILGKIDWNITDSHRLAVTYQRTKGNSFNGSVTSTFAQGNSTTQPRIGLESLQYNKQETLTQYTAQLNSDWSDVFSTELRLGAKETETTQLPLGGLTVGDVTVNVADLPGVSAGSGTPQIRFGADSFRHDNYLDVKTKNAELIARFNVGDHNLMLGGRVEAQDIVNVFVSNSLGTWTFNSYADYLAGRVGRFSLTGAVDPDGGTVPATLGTAREGQAAFKYKLFSFYAEDSWQALDNLNLTYGLRYDWYDMNDRPVENAAFISRQGFSNAQSLNGKNVLLPRLSFKWEPMDRFTVSGGAGRFSSQGLNVWISNPFANDGVRQTNAVCSGPIVVTTLTEAPANCTLTPGNGSTNVLDPDLKIPTVWKANLSLAYDFDLGALGDGWRAQADFLAADYRNSLHWVDLRSQQIGTAPDGRPIYGRTTTGTIGANVYDLMLTNLKDGGRSRAWSLSLAKAWDEGFAKGLSFQATYTHTDATDRSPMSSSIALSSYGRFASMDHQHPDEATSDYEIKHRFSLNVGWQRKLFGDNETAITVFAQRRSGMPFSYTFHNSRSGNFDNDFGNLVTSYSGRQATSNQLFYVPQTDGSGAVTATSDPRVTYAAGFDLDTFNALLKSSGLIKYAGGIAPRNAFRSKSVTTIDLRLSQELPGFFPSGAKIKLYMDIENFGNMLNSKWGVLEQYTYFRGVPVADVSIVDGQYVYSSLQAANPYVVTNASLWQIKVGARFAF